MERNIFEKQRELNDRLNRYRDEYYNRNAPSVWKIAWVQTLTSLCICLPYEEQV